MRNMIKVNNLSYSVKLNENTIHILNHLDLDIKQGEMIAISGPSGSGKTTLLYALAGLLDVEAGHVFLEDKDIYQMKLKEREKFRLNNLSIIYQNYNLMPFLNVMENITLPFLLAKEKINYGKIDELLQIVGLADAKTKSIASLSGGEQQRVSIVRALATQAGILLADEPTGNLDRENTTKFCEYLKKAIKSMGITTVIVSHDEYVCNYCDDVVRLVDGHIV